MGARGGRAKDDEAGSGDVVMTKNFYRVGKRGDFGGDPGLALGLFNKKAELTEGFDPDRPQGGEVLRVNNEDYVVNIGKDLNNVFGVSVGESERGLVEKVVNGCA